MAVFNPPLEKKRAKTQEAFATEIAKRPPTARNRYKILFCAGAARTATGMHGEILVN